MTKPLTHSSLEWDRVRPSHYLTDALQGDRESFGARHPGPFLVYVLQPDQAEAAPAFGTLAGRPLGTSRVLEVVPAVKRSDANPFAMMITIGRAANNDIHVSAADVSKFHAYLTQVGSEWRIADAGSTYGTYVDGLRLAKSAATPISAESEIRIASLEARLVSSEDLHALLRRS